MLPLNLYARVRFFAQFCTRDRGCSAHPVFPAPFCFRGGTIQQTSGAASREKAEVCVSPSLRGATRRSNPVPGRKTGLPRRSAPRNDVDRAVALFPSPAARSVGSLAPLFAGRGLG